MTKSFNSKIKKNKRVARMIFKKYGHPSDLFGIILYLISDPLAMLQVKIFTLMGFFIKRNLKSSEENFFIAEIGINHNGDIEIAKKLIDLAKDTGFNAAKFQKRDMI